jgi:glucan phosphorylase
MRKPGCVAAVIYFRYPNGHLVLAPFSDCPTPDGAIKEEADTLTQIDKLVDQLRKQEYETSQREMHYDQSLMASKDKEIRDRIYQRISSSATTEYEKEFLRLYMQLRDERKREMYRQRFMEAQWYLAARENNLGDRAADKEEVNLDKVNF